MITHDPTTVDPPRRTRRWWLVATPIVVLIFGAGFGFAYLIGRSPSPLPTPTPPPAPAMFTLRGSVTVYNDFTGSLDIATDTNCQGAKGYSDLTPGTAVTVQGPQGQIVATGSLQMGTPGDGHPITIGDFHATSFESCSMPFTVPGVPQGLTSYSVTVSHRGTQVFSADQAAFGGVHLSIGR